MDGQKRPDGLCSGLSITSLFLSILGFLTGWLGFGMFLDCLGVVFGVIAIITGKKRNAPCGMAVAGIIVGVLGAGLMLFLMYFPTVTSFIVIHPASNFSGPFSAA